jgi:hypothetical protein
MRLFSLYFIAFFFSGTCFSQELKKQLDEVYNLDPELYNGRIFSNVYGNNVNGHQYFEERNFRRNELGLNHKVYEEQYINYDVYAQKLLLTYLDDNNAQKIIEIPQELVQFFSIGNNYFEMLLDEDNNYRIFQSFTFNKNKILIYWTKNLTKNTGAVYYDYRFTKMEKQIFLLLNGQYYKVKNNKRFVNQFPDEEQANIQKWLKANKIKIQKADNSAFELLTKYLSE